MGLQPWLSLYQWLCATSKNGKNLPQTKVVKKTRWTAILRNYVLDALNLSFWPIFSLKSLGARLDRTMHVPRLATELTELPQKEQVNRLILKAYLSMAGMTIMKLYTNQACMKHSFTKDSCTKRRCFWCFRCFWGASNDFLNKASCLTAFCAWASWEWTWLVQSDLPAPLWNELWRTVLL